MRWQCIRNAANTFSVANTLQRFKVESKIWYDILMSKDGSKDADIYKFKDKSKVEMKNETATEEIFQ